MEDKKPIEKTKPLTDEALDQVSGGRRDGDQRPEPEKDTTLSDQRRRPGY